MPHQAPKEHPILFSGEMVRAILDGRKTQTRRVCTKLYDGSWCIDPDDSDEEKQELIEACPYGKAGDRLWVRETFYQERGGYSDSECGEWHGVWLGDKRYEGEEIPKDPNRIFRKRPGIYMPRWASRITLEVVKIRVERLQDITNDDAKAEGVTAWHDTTVGTVYIPEFKMLWDSINAKRGYSWERNPWVWVIEFKRIRTCRN